MEPERLLLVSQSIATKGMTAMGLFTKDIKSMQDLFMHTLKDMYYAENKIEKSLPDMIEKATNRELKTGLEHHRRETQNQIKRLEQVFAALDAQPEGTHCPSIDGIIKEANDTAGEIEDEKVLNVALIASAQAVEHYEITRYGTLIAWADELGYRGSARLLQQNLAEEKAADKKLTALAEGGANRKAAAKPPHTRRGKAKASAGGKKAARKSPHHRRRKAA
jgi:ferritin-like metal-binding protein YciE